MNFYTQYSIMSSVFLTERIPEELFTQCDEEDSFDALDDFIREHRIETLENVSPEEVWELIEECTNVAYHTRKRN